VRHPRPPSAAEPRHESRLRPAARPRPQPRRAAGRKPDHRRRCRGLSLEFRDRDHPPAGADRPRRLSPPGAAGAEPGLLAARGRDRDPAPPAP
jgi:hypothetical protein